MHHKSMEMESGGLPPPPYGVTAPPHYGSPPSTYETAPPHYPTASPQPLAPSYQPRSKPSPSFILGVVNLVLRILTSIFLLIGLIILAINSVLILDVGTLHFGDIISYRYEFSVIVIGFLYTLVQIGFAVFRMIMGAQRGKVMLIFDFYGDKCISYLLATGAAAGFGASIDLNRAIDLGDFPNKGNSASSLVFMAFLFTLASSIISSYTLPKCSSIN